MNLETKIIIYKFTPQVFTLTPKRVRKEKLDIQTVVQLVQWVQRLFCFTHMRLCTLLHNAYIIYIHACVR
jgi:hypothetical protein